MTGVELIVAALAAGGSAGVTNSATAVVQDAYAALKGLLGSWLAGRRQAVEALEAGETEPRLWQAKIGDDLAGSGASADEEVLAAARRLLELVDAARTGAGRYVVDARGASGVQVGDMNIDASYGATAGTMAGPVTIGYGQLPVPPTSPGAA